MIYLNTEHGVLRVACVARLLADKWTPGSDLEDQLKHRSLPALLCSLLEVQHGIDLGHGNHEGLRGDSHDHGEEYCRHRIEGHKLYQSALISAGAMASRALEMIAFKKGLQGNVVAFPFLRLPFEIRLQVYDYCFSTSNDESFYEDINCYWWYDKIDIPSATCLAIIFANHQIHSEVEPILYQHHTFDFGFQLSEGFLFLQNISERARSNIRSIRMMHTMRRADNDLFGRSNKEAEDWTSICTYIAKNLQLHEFDFDCFVDGVPGRYADAIWVQDLVQIQGLRRLSQNLLVPEGLRRALAKDGEGAVEPNNILEARLQAFLKYLRSKMLANDAPEPSAEDMVWKSDKYYTTVFYRDDEEPEW